MIFALFILCLLVFGLCALGGIFVALVKLLGCAVRLIFVLADWMDDGLRWAAERRRPTVTRRRGVWP